MHFLLIIIFVHFQDPNYIAAIHTDSPKAVILDIRCVKLVDLSPCFLECFRSYALETYLTNLRMPAFPLKKHHFPVCFQVNCFN